MKVLMHDRPDTNKWEMVEFDNIDPRAIAKFNEMFDGDVELSHVCHRIPEVGRWDVDYRFVFENSHTTEFRAVAGEDGQWEVDVEMWDNDEDEDFFDEEDEDFEDLFIDIGGSD